MTTRIIPYCPHGLVPPGRPRCYADLEELAVDARERLAATGARLDAAMAELKAQTRNALDDAKAAQERMDESAGGEEGAV